MRAYWLRHAPSARIPLESAPSGADRGARRAARSRHRGGFRRVRPPNTNNVILAQQTAPGTPSEVTVTRGDGTLTASWDAVDGATTYHVTYSSDGKASWSLAALDHPADGNTTNGVTSITFDADNAKTYVVGVRAKNGAGGSGWRNSPASGPYTPPAPTPPAAVGAVTVTRADGTLTASWDAPAGAATYHVTYTDNGAQSWQLAALDHPAGGGSDESITFDADNGSTYIVGVRAKNGAGGSNWVNSPASGPFTPPTPDPTPDPTPEPTPDPTPTPEPAPPARPTGLTATGGDGSVTLSWDDPGDPSITGYEYRTRRAPPAPGWGPWTAIAGSGAGTTSHAFTGLTNGAEHRFKLRAVNALGSSPAAPSDAPWYVAATPAAAPVTLTADGVTATGATLTLGNWDGEWYYSASAASGGGASGASQTCSGPVNGQQTTVTGLAPDTSYTITAYANGCGGEAIAAGGVVTQSRTLTPSSPGLTSVTLTRAGFTGNWYYNFPELSNACFGPVSGDSVTYDGLASGTDYTVTAYSGQNCNFGTQAGASFSTTGPRAPHPRTQRERPHRRAPRGLERRLVLPEEDRPEGRLRGLHRPRRREPGNSPAWERAKPTWACGCSATRAVRTSPPRPPPNCPIPA